MFGWVLLRTSEIALQAELTETRISALTSELAASMAYSAKCERLIEHERERIDSERERADRIADSVFQSNGLPATSATVIQEQRAAEAIAADKRTDYTKQLFEIYGEMESDLLDDEVEPLPEMLAETFSK